MKEIFTKLEEIQRTGKRAALCIIVSTKGSTPRKAGSKMVVSGTGDVFGTIGGGRIEKIIIEKAIEISKNPDPVKFEMDLEEDSEMLCGGSVEVYIEPIRPSQKLIIFGAGHIGSKLAGYATDFGFSVTIIDHREEWLKALSALGMDTVQANYIEGANKLQTDENTYFVVVTPKHEFDVEVTGLCAKKPHRYLGMIGSKKKVAAAKKQYADQNLLTPQEIENIDMPIGIKFNAQTPEEIAISILARLIDERNSG
nr:XdhC family protein [Bacteroidota bacterium]